MEDMIRLEAPVSLCSISQLEQGFEESTEESVFEWLRKVLETEYLLLTSDKGFKAYKKGVQ